MSMTWAVPNCPLLSPDATVFLGDRCPIVLDALPIVLLIVKTLIFLLSQIPMGVMNESQDSTRTVSLLGRSAAQCRCHLKPASTLLELVYVISGPGSCTMDGSSKCDWGRPWEVKNLAGPLGHCSIWAGCGQLFCILFVAILPCSIGQKTTTSNSCGAL